MQFRMPDPGEGLTEAEVVSWRIKVGDEVTVNQPILEIETAKSLVEIPSPVSGTVEALLVSEGDLVPVGAPIVTIDETGAATAAAPSEPAERRQPVLVGYGPRTSELRSRRRPASSQAQTPPAAEQSVVAESVRPLAKPPIRKLAKDLGVDLSTITPTGPGGIITRDDVRAVKEAQGAAASQVAASPETRETRTPIRGVRKATAEAMVASAFTAPQVTTWVTVDVTRSMRVVRRLGAPISPLLLIIRAMLVAVARHPEINAAWDEQAGEIVTKHYVNVGVAATTPRGLLVPVIRNADRRPISDLAAELNRLVTAARDGSASPADLQGGTISITNIGVFGVDGGTPILPPGQSAILGAGRIARKPWVHKGRVVPRDVVELTLSFDHRLIDGDLGSRFLADVAALLEHPDLALLWG